MLSKTLVLALVLLAACAYGLPKKTATHEDSWEEKSASVDLKAIKSFLSQFATVKPSVRVNEPKFMQIKTSTATPAPTEQMCGSQPCAYCDDIGCCTSDAEGTYCKENYAANKAAADEANSAPSASPTQLADPYMAGCGALGNCDHNGMIGGSDDPRTKYQFCDFSGCGTTDGSQGTCTGESMGSCGEQICRYCDDTGCCTSDPDGCYCRERYAENLERMREREASMEAILASMSCGTCTDCTADEITTRLAGMGAPPGLTCAVIHQAGFCTQVAPIAPALCPVSCAAPCTTSA